MKRSLGVILLLGGLRCSASATEREALRFPLGIAPGMSLSDVERFLGKKEPSGTRWRLSGQLQHGDFRPTFVGIGFHRSKAWERGWAEKIKERIAHYDLKEIRPEFADLEFRSKNPEAYEELYAELNREFGQAANVIVYQDNIANCEELRAVFASAREFIGASYKVQIRNVASHLDPAYAAAACLNGKHIYSATGRDGYQLELQGENDLPTMSKLATAREEPGLRRQGDLRFVVSLTYGRQDQNLSASSQSARARIAAEKNTGRVSTPEERAYSTNAQSGERGLRWVVFFWLGLLWFGLLCLSLYFLPSMVAVGRKHRNILPIILLNVVLGWTIIGWVVSLVWSLTRDAESKAP